MFDFELLSSPQNEKIKNAAALLSSPARKRTGLFIIEGARLCADAAVNGARIKEFFATPAAAGKYAPEFELISRAAEKTYMISDAPAKKLSDTDTPQGLFCVCEKQEKTLEYSGSGFYLITENIQNPDNLGAIARSAEAFGADGLIVAGGCDVYSPKALRASMGALLRFPVECRADAVQAVRDLKRRGIRVYAAALDKNAVSVTDVGFPGGKAVVIGNEGSGISEELMSECDSALIIPMKGRAESLNAAAAASIIIWELTKG